MANFALRLPNSIYDDLKQVAEIEGVSMNQFVMSAVSERVALAKIMSNLNKNTVKMAPNELVAFLDENVSNNKPLSKDEM
ncbi:MULTISPECIES: Arc family DNA-binding protein [Cysteiniphilum]|uniref:Arc family DNA-binding protein n=1 Tax=Cysteiniphilum TaxID=2056696 RepID=UPI00177D6776|nr:MULTISPECIES: Arc family DNA-binding protein [Cysteiniphilum]